MAESKPPGRRSADAAAAAAAAESTVIAATANVEADVLAARRRGSINRLWETMQAVLAFELVSAAIIASFLVLTQGTSPPPSSTTIAALLFLTNSASGVIGFYFGRTNHTRPTPTDPQGKR